MSEAASWAAVEPAALSPDPVIEAYKRDVDRTLFTSTLALTVEERLRDLMRLQRFAKELRRAGRPSMTDLETALQALARGGVDFIIVGGVAATIHGSARLTRDLDIVYAGTPTSRSRQRSATFICSARLSVAAPTEDVLPHTQPVAAFGVTARCVNLFRLIHLKRAAGRPRDLEAIAELEALRNQDRGERVT